MIDDLMIIALKPFIPKMKRALKNGVVDKLLLSLKVNAEKAHDIKESEAVDFIISYENNDWFVSFVVFANDGTFRILESNKIDSFVNLLINGLNAA